MMANEGACIAGNGPSFSGCRLNCILPTESFNTVDSIYIFNNLFQNISSAFSFWEGNTNINGVNCIRNIFIFNNTVIGVLGDSTANTIGIVNLYFPSYNVLFNSYYSYLSNARVYNNIFSYDTSAYLHLIPVRKVVNTFHPGPIDITFSNNLWVQSHTYLGTGDVVRNSLPFSVPLLKDSTSTITPCETNQNFIYDVPAGVVGVSTDYNYSARRSPRSNVGAIEFDSSCLLHTGIYPILSAPLFVSYPNPFDQTITVAISAPYSEALFDNLNLEVQDAVGKILLKQKIISAQTTLNLANLSKGIYLLRFQQGQHSEWRKIIKQ